ncbi:hypothetical protein DCM91_13320 [Chitinophaga costaii]|nr:hypothetical protein DCM91_13320 [Chitinophaga costaii]
MSMVIRLQRKNRWHAGGRVYIFGNKNYAERKNDLKRRINYYRGSPKSCLQKDKIRFAITGRILL